MRRLNLKINSKFPKVYYFGLTIARKQICRNPDTISMKMLNTSMSHGIANSAGAYVANWTRVFFACKKETPNAFLFFTFF